VDFQDELAKVLPTDLPHRENVIAKGAKHLDLITQINDYLNLTRITTPREAAIKHVLDSIIPWSLLASARHILDAGTGAGFPGIPLSLALPEKQFTLSESIQKKARFVESAVETLDLSNVEVTAERAEDLLTKNRRNPIDVIVARAVAPLSRTIVLFAPAVKAGARALLYKGPVVENEIAEASAEARKRNITMHVVQRYDLPDGLGTRTIVEMSRQKA
jgi:16S rRNA (guanine527-N7)-methyltransferase